MSLIAHVLLSAKLCDTLTPTQLALLAKEQESQEQHTTRWMEASEKKLWAITAHACQIAPDRCLVWCQTDEAGITDAELHQTDDAEEAAINHAHMTAARFDGTGHAGYVRRILAKWERGTGTTPMPLETDADLETCAQSWVDASRQGGDRETQLIAVAMLGLL